MVGVPEQEGRLAPGWYETDDGGGRRFFDGHAWVVLEPAVQRRHGRGDRVVPVVVVPVVLVVLATSLVVARTVAGRMEPSSSAVAVVVLVSYGPVLAVVLVARRRWVTLGHTDISWTLRRADLLWGPVAWSAIVVLQVFAVAVLLVLDVPIAGNLDRVVGGTASRLLLVVVAVGVAPVVEEITFRGVVLGGLLQRIGAPGAVIVQALVFGAAHVDPTAGWSSIGTAVVLGAVGVGIGAVVVSTNRLGAAVVAHAMFNGVALAVAWTGLGERAGIDLFGG
jgi:membrane protease YdiL (CAAX protease family)